MSKLPRFVRKRAPSVALACLIGFLLLLWLAGGASRGDVGGQAVVRGGAALCLIIFLLSGARLQERPPLSVSLFMAAAVLLVALQLVPLPPSWWSALPGRSVFADALVTPLPWRPISIAPDATVNALFSLLPPLTVLVLMLAVRVEERTSLLIVLIGLATLSMVLGLLQVADIRLYSPFINGGNQISANFANRNHLALMLAIGCTLVPCLVFGNTSNQGRRHGSRHVPVIWRIVAALGFSILFLLLILAAGSRSGILLGVLGMLFGVFAAREAIVSRMARFPRKMAWAIAGGTFAILMAFVVASIAMQRADALKRVAQLDSGEDMRARALPTVLRIIEQYFPVGTGFGTFDPVFRIHEPFQLLKPTYFNHAHNDFLEVVIEGGAPALLIVAAVLVWWLLRSVRVWRWSKEAPQSRIMGRLGSSVLFLIFLGSAVDYPARTPMLMAIAVIAGVWLSWADPHSARRALPPSREVL